MPQEKLAAQFHNLFSRKIRPIHSWHEWLQRWQVAVTLEEMSGLLHVGLDVPENRYPNETQYSYFDQVTFYLTIADGWADRYPFLVAEGDTDYIIGRDKYGNVIQKTSSELRQQLARKAFDVLCTNFFKLEEHKERNGSVANWIDEIISGQILLSLQEFFRSEKSQLGNRIRIRNLSERAENRSHGEQQVVDFFIVLAKSVWEWKEEDVPSWRDAAEKNGIARRNDEMRSRLLNAKPWLVEILSQVDQLDILEKWLLKLDRACLVKLEEIALRGELRRFDHPVSEDRRVASTDEACFLGSKAAWLIKKIELAIREFGRLNAIVEEERRVAEAHQHLRELTSGKK